MTGPQVFKNVLQNILESIPKLVDVCANDGELIEEELCDHLPGFSPTREELIHLVKHWLKMIIDDHWIWFFDKQELHREHTLYVAKCRIERILECGVFFEQGKGLGDSMKKNGMIKSLIEQHSKIVLKKR